MNAQAAAVQAEEFDQEAAFEEMVAKREGAAQAPETPAAEPEEPAPQVLREEPAAADATKEAGKEPAEPGAQAAPAPAKEVAAPKLSDDDEALIQAAPEGKRDALRTRLTQAEATRLENQRLDQSNRSMAGRMSAYQRRYEEAAGKRPAEVKQEASTAEVAEWKQFTEDYPDIAKAIEARFAATLPAGTAPEMAAVVEYVQEEQRTRFLNDAFSAVEDVHPGWRALVNQKEFAEWKESTPAYQRLASSDDVTDAIALIDLWKAHHPNAAPAGPSAAEAAEAAKLAARRGAQIEGARTPNQREQSPAPETVDASDPDALFAFYAKKANHRLKTRYQ